ncbi:hypothetical protein GCM10007962_10430 [Yeosuana aromativorans]|uniref:Outer membrane protein beta-barrel domain-containing protein n=1 Tax=Yeosuana aromativorans TaxID=288019 RepID=A0A8J3BKR9_9FLAO|nr:MipA/OmpV family protein [Yeosuana aromativorans]GGK18161.1 hypothetical protein GCM10007962_10430 [Yeosuana aromativorans]
MKPYNIILSLFVLVILINNPILAQNNTDAMQPKKNNGSSYFSLSLNYISDAVYLGRKDSITAPYLYPSISYHNKTGLYAMGSFSYLTKPDESRIDLFLGSLGYDFTNKKFSGDISFTKYFFNSDSYNVISEVDADITASLKYDFNLINLMLSSTCFINKNGNSDFFISSEISHDFVTTDKKIQISPSMGVYFGSQNFYEEYYIYNRFGSERTTGSGQGSGQGTGQGTGGTGGTGGTVITTETTTTTVMLQESKKFGLMAIEFSVPIWYINKPFIVSFLPTLVIPQNPATLTVDSEVYKEDLKSTFYWMAGISYRF